MPSSCWTSFKLSHSECSVLVMSPPLALYSFRRSLLNCVHHNAGEWAHKMNKAELRVRWEERVSTADKGVLDKLWQDLTEQYSDYIDDALRDSRIIADLVDLAEDRIEYWRLESQRGKPRGRTAQTIVEVELDYYEKECAETASLYLVKKAASLPEVRCFRQERLGGKLLTTEEAEEFLRGELKGDVSDDRPLSDLDELWIGSVSDMGLEVV